MNNNPKVTVVTVTHNLIHAGRKEFFRQCVESVYNQTYKNIEHIIIDGASNDGTLDLIKQYADKGWITYYSERDHGIYNAMNKGIDKSNGDYINFLNSDDYFNHPDGIKLSVQSLLETKADFSFAKSIFINTQGKYLGTLIPVIESFLFRMPFCHQTMLIKKEVICNLGKFDEEFYSAADFDFVLRLCLSGAKFVEVPLPFVSYRKGGISDLNQEQGLKEYAKSCSKNLDRFIEYDDNTYKNMYSNLMMPKNLYESIINNIGHEYKIKLIDLIKNYSENKGDFFKINKYPRFEEISNFKDNKKNSFLNFRTIIKRIINKS